MLMPRKVAEPPSGRVPYDLAVTLVKVRVLLGEIQTFLHSERRENGRQQTGLCIHGRTTEDRAE